MGWLRERWVQCLVLSDVCARRGGCAIASAHVVVNRNAAAASTISIVVIIEFTKTIIRIVNNDNNNNNNNNNNIDSKQNSIDRTIVDEYSIDTDEHYIDNDIRFAKFLNEQQQQFSDH